MFCFSVEAQALEALMFAMQSAAVAKEKEQMLGHSIETLMDLGFNHFNVVGYASYPAPEKLHIPVFNVAIRPDILACRTGDPRPLVAMVEVSSALGDDYCSRYWQYLNAWASVHRGYWVVYVHPEDVKQARSLARHWHLDSGAITGLRRH